MTLTMWVARGSSLGPNVTWLQQVLWTVTVRWDQEASGAGGTKEEKGGRSWCRGHGEGVAYWVAPHCLLNLLSYNTQDHHLWNGTTHNDCLPTGPSITKKLLYRLAHSLSWWRHFLNWHFLLSNDNCLCQVDTNLSSTKRHLLIHVHMWFPFLGFC